jgi:uncharacterized membrane protein
MTAANPAIGGPERTHLGLRTWTTPPGTFVLIAFVLGTCLVLLIPPFQGADEPYHFLRAYQITEGQWVDRQHDLRGFAGGYLPRSLYEVWVPFSKIGFHPSVKASVRQILDAMQIQFRPDDRIFITFPNTAHYCPTCYLAQSLGILAGRAFQLPPLAMLYLGREANLLAWMALGYWALRASPAIARPLFLLLLMPMSLWVATTLSADSLVNATAALFTAQVCKHSGRKPNSLGRKQIASLLILSVFLSVSKLAYAPLVALLLLIPVENFGGLRKWIVNMGLIVAINLVAWGGWSWASAGLDTRITFNREVSPRAQLEELEQNPERVPKLVLGTLEKRGWSFLESFVGLIGWLDVYLPAPFIVGYLLFLLLGCWVANDLAPLPSPGLAALIVLPAVLISIAAIALLSYLYWTPLGLDFIDGFHGRYLIPLTPAMMVVVCSFLRRLPVRISSFLTDRQIDLILAILVCGSSIFFVVLVWGRYYGWIRGESAMFS